jgi:hypothetical protein
MSAGAVGVRAPESVPPSGPDPRPSLRLVVSNGALSRDERVGRAGGSLADGLPAIRLTRRGRLVITLMAMVAAAILAMVVASTVDAAPPQIDHVTVVSAGLTLSEIAATQLPTLPINDAVARIQLANGLNTFQVHAGQSLLIPAVP